MKIDDRVTDPAPRLEDAQKCATLPALSARPNSLQDVADLAAKITRASGAALALAKPTGEIVCAARSGEAAPAVGAVLDSSHGISAACVRKIEVQHCTDTEADPRVDAEVCRRLGIRSILVLPLHRGGRVAGLLSVYSRYASNFDHHDVAGLEYLQSVAAWLPDAEPPKAQLAQTPVADRLAHEKPLMEAAEPETVSTPEINATARDYKQGTKDNAEFESQLNGSVAPVSEPGVDELAGWLQPQRSTRLRPLFISLGIIAIAALVLAGSRFIRMHSSHSSLQRAPAVVMSETPPSTASSPFVSLPTEPPQSIAETSAAAESAPDAGVGHVQSINSMVGPGYARVTIGLDHGVQYTAFRLDRPERICFDLRNTRFSPSVRRRTIAVSGLALRSIRSSQYQQNVVRVVLDLNTRAAYSVAYQADPPRLVIEVNSGREEHRGTANSLAAAPTPRADASASGAKELVIALDPGHGGDDLGAVGRQGLQEKQLVLDVALRLGALLKSELRAKVVYTRRDDQLVPIEQRSTAANQAGANLFISIHANGSNDPSATGVETYSPDVAASNQRAQAAQRDNGDSDTMSSAERLRQSRVFARRVQDSLYGGLRSDHVRNRGVRSAPLAVLRAAQMPSILVEISFLSSPEEEHRLYSDQFRQQIAEALYQGIRRHVAVTMTSNPARAVAKQRSESIW